ncbi:entry exclusion lipoprotein TrbK [Falsochrobactrum sp. TDYN1]|uniref:Entry exclusion lipoprotein TrbK n=1 Tax=Falsochrobactrum tianjinense TaxID=2706015 RepID=A0A949PRV8_9HYPH|nr:entry exclusion lipoprotein TrbK [Falsochrobactrum sp. TDYN1]MBV2143750.1 entry exclusion lipoprotein TrbK [Falsochrobactrum sp. TDYN1]
MKTMRFIAALVIAVGLAGCGDSKVEATASTCADDYIQKALDQMSREADRIAFLDECETIKRIEALNRPGFKPSAPSKY